MLQLKIILGNHTQRCTQIQTDIERFTINVSAKAGVNSESGNLVGTALLPVSEARTFISGQDIVVDRAGIFCDIYQNLLLKVTNHFLAQSVDTF